MDFKHVLLTRFNVKGVLKESDLKIRGILTDEDWLEHRFGLFDRFCYPSVRAQSNQEFTWVVLFDAGTPARFRARIEAYAAWENFHPVFLQQFDIDVVRGHVGRLLDGHTHLITTRLDNDDAIHRDLIARVQQQFRGQDKHFVNFSNGYKWHDEQIFQVSMAHNPFISLIEKASGFDTILCAAHNELHRLGPIDEIEEAPRWLQVIHDRNVRNRLSGARRPLSELDGHFVLGRDSGPEKEKP